MLIACDTDSACEYTQCIDCILKGGGGVCTKVGCMHIHYSCPHCRKTVSGDGLLLTDG